MDVICNNVAKPICMDVLRVRVRLAVPQFSWQELSLQISSSSSVELSYFMRVWFDLEETIAGTMIDVGGSQELSFGCYRYMHAPSYEIPSVTSDTLGLFPA